MPWVEWTYHKQMVKLDIMKAGSDLENLGSFQYLPKLPFFVIVFFEKREPEISPPPIKSLFLVFCIKIKLCIIFTKGDSARLLDA